MLPWQTLLGIVKIPSAGPAGPGPSLSTTVQREGPNRGGSRKTPPLNPFSALDQWPSEVTHTNHKLLIFILTHLYVTHHKDTPGSKIWKVKSSLSLGTTCQCSSYLSCGNTWILLRPRTENSPLCCRSTFWPQGHWTVVVKVVSSVCQVKCQQTKSKVTLKS